MLLYLGLGFDSRTAQFLAKLQDAKFIRSSKYYYHKFVRSGRLLRKEFTYRKCRICRTVLRIKNFRERSIVQSLSMFIVVVCCGENLSIENVVHTKPSVELRILGRILSQNLYLQSCICCRQLIIISYVIELEIKMNFVVTKQFQKEGDITCDTSHKFILREKKIKDSRGEICSALFNFLLHLLVLTFAFCCLLL